jgi:hypothetical protein
MENQNIAFKDRDQVLRGTPPRYLICRETPEVPGCETLLDTHTGLWAKIHRFNKPDHYESYRHSRDERSPKYALVDNYRISIEYIAYLGTTPSVPDIEEFTHLRLMEMMAYMSAYIAKLPDSFLKFKI